MSLVHIPAGSCNQSNYARPARYTSTCATFQAGDSWASGTYPSDITCPICYSILIGRAQSPCLPYGMS